MTSLPIQSRVSTINDREVTKLTVEIEILKKQLSDYELKLKNSSNEQRVTV